MTVLKALSAAASGRILLLVGLPRELHLTLRQVVTTALWEMPLIAAFALLGWHAAAVLGLVEESGRIVVTAMLANLGARGLDRLLARLLSLRQDPPP